MWLTETWCTGLTSWGGFHANKIVDQAGINRVTIIIPRLQALPRPPKGCIQYLLHCLGDESLSWSLLDEVSRKGYEAATRGKELQMPRKTARAHRPHTRERESGDSRGRISRPCDYIIYIQKNRPLQLQQGDNVPCWCQRHCSAGHQRWWVCGTVRWHPLLFASIFHLLCSAYHWDPQVAGCIV